jgi:hypothetical protein
VEKTEQQMFRIAMPKTGCGNRLIGRLLALWQRALAASNATWLRCPGVIMPERGLPAMF